MCRQCEDCINAKFSRGSQRGVMDCDPDEYWCDANNDFYYYGDDYDLEKELKAEYIEKLVSEGIDEEEAKNLADETEFEIECPDYSPGHYYDDYYGVDEDPDAYDRWRDAQFEQEID